MLIDLQKQLKAYRMVSPGDTVICAVSGGADSVALLFGLYLLKEKLGITQQAAHFNHQLRGMESDRDEAFVRDWCAEHDIPFVCGRGNVRALAAEKGLTLEEAAREARYAFLTQQQRALGCAFVLLNTKWRYLCLPSYALLLYTQLFTDVDTMPETQSMLPIVPKNLVL